MSVKELYDTVMTKYGEPVKYVFYGGITTLITWGTYAVFVWLGWDLLLSHVLSWICGVTFAFISNKWMVFESKSTEKKVLAYETSSFVLCRIFTFVVAFVMFPILCSIGMDQEFLGVKGFLAKIITSVVEIVLNWILSKYLIFNEKISHREK